MAKAVGDPFPKPPVSSAVAKVVVSGGSTTYDLTSNVATLLSKKMISSSSSIASSATIKWSLIAGRLPGRTDNEIKNYWNTHIRRKLISRGIDPTTHRPLHESPSDQNPKPTHDSTNTSPPLEPEIPHEMPDDDTTRGLMVTCKDELSSDLNLELRISLPDHGLNNGGGNGKRTTRCFACSLGVTNGTECGCGTMRCDVVGAGSSSDVHGYDFLGVSNNTNSIMDFRTLEMK